MGGVAKPACQGRHRLFLHLQVLRDIAVEFGDLRRRRASHLRRAARDQGQALGVAAAHPGLGEEGHTAAQRRDDGAEHAVARLGVPGIVGRDTALEASEIRGRIVNQLTMLPLDGVNVVAVDAVTGDPSVGRLSGARLQPTGEFSLPGIPPGTYDLRLLDAVQQQCGFAEGELRCIMVESQPMGQGTLAWTIADARAGVLEQGKVDVAALCALQPWPAGEPLIDAQSGDAQRGDAQRGDAPRGDAQRGDVPRGDAQRGDAQRSDAQGS